VCLDTAEAASEVTGPSKKLLLVGNGCCVLLLGFELRASYLLSRAVPLEPCPRPFRIIFLMGSCIFAPWSLDCDPPTYASHIAGIISMYHGTQPLS
jgi:hypothetical protein